MKTTIIASIFFLSILSLNVNAQPKPPRPPGASPSGEKFGKTVNLSVGVGGYSGFFGYVGQSMPVLSINYEFDVAKNFTLAAFASFYTYRNKHYRELVIPAGVKGTYYFDQILRANPKWDFYMAGSIGFAYSNSTWDGDYLGDRNFSHKAKPFYLDIHAGAEYHITKRIGTFLDLSSSVSSIGIAIH